MSLERLHKSVQATFRTIKESPTALALGFVFLLNAGLLLADPLKRIDPQSMLAAKSWVWWTTREFLEQKPPADVVLLSSSLMMNPIWLHEANYLQKNVDIVTNHRSVALDDQIKSTIPESNARCFNFALPGAMISDAYIAMKGLMHGDRKPSVVVLGLWPRDLIDNRFCCAAASDHWGYLQRFSDTSCVADIAMPELWQRAYYGSAPFFYVETRKHDLQMLLSQIAKERFGGYLGTVAKPCKVDSKPLSVVWAIYNQEVVEGVNIAKPNEHTPYIAATASEFSRRVKRFKEDTYKNQLAWLNKCLSYCKENNIRPVLLNLPVSDDAIKMFPPGVYDKCVAVMKDVANEHGATFVDLQASGKFAFSDFGDAVHMNEIGGEKLVKQLAHIIEHNQDLRLAVIKSHRTDSVASSKPKTGM